MYSMRATLVIILFVISVGLSHGQQELPEAPLEAVLFGASFGQFEKVEIGIRPSFALNRQINNFLQKKSVPKKERVNPFLEWELNIQAEFTHVASGKKVIQPGFYYREMDRDERINGWIDKENEYPLRIRFSAADTGRWEVELHVTVNDSIRHPVQDLSFDIGRSENIGIVGVSENNSNFMRGGEVIVPTGINLPHPYMGNNMLYSLYPEEKLNMEAWKLFQDDVKQFANEGGKYFRFFMGPSASDIEFEELGNYYDRLNYAWEIDQMLVLCESKDVLIDFNMMLHTPFMLAGDYYQFRWDYSSFWPDPKAWPYKDPNPIYCYAKTFNSTTPSDMFLNTEAMKYIKQRYRYMIARWGYSTSIMMWEPMSEPWHINENGFSHDTPYDSLTGNKERKAVHQFHKEMAHYIKKELGDPHLIGAVGRFPSGDQRIFSHLEIEGMEYSDSTWYDENIDVLSISYYTPSPEKSILSKPGKSSLECESGENSMYCLIQRLTETYSKPVFFAEADHGDGTHVCSNMQGNKLDLMRYPISGAAGHFVWAAFGYSYGDKQYAIDERDIWKEAILAERYFNSVTARAIFNKTTIQGRERQRIRGASKSVKNHEYRLSQDRKKGIGYIYNRTFNAHTAGSADGIPTTPESPCFINESDFQTAQEITWRPNKMSIDGLNPRQRYTIRYYGFETGQFVNAFEIRANMFGKAKLVHPVLGVIREEHPFFWYQLTAE